MRAKVKHKILLGEDGDGTLMNNTVQYSSIVHLNGVISNNIFVSSYPLTTSYDLSASYISCECNSFSLSTKIYVI